jgi:hypothetical protein
MEPELSVLYRHPRWNHLTWRVELTGDEIQKLPVKTISIDQLHQAQCGWWFNPAVLYPKDLSPLAGEAGYDNAFRYIVDGT